LLYRIIDVLPDFRFLIAGRSLPVRSWYSVYQPFPELFARKIGPFTLAHSGLSSVTKFTRNTKQMTRVHARCTAQYRHDEIKNVADIIAYCAAAIARTMATSSSCAEEFATQHGRATASTL
jgi:hypothetical protein